MLADHAVAFAPTEGTKTAATLRFEWLCVTFKQIRRHGVKGLVRLAAGFASLSLLLLVWTALAAPFEDGVAAYERGDYVAAIQLWQPLAERGDAAAQFNIALLYDTGRGVPEDDGMAARWYRLSAVQGYAKAQFSLGTMYDSGRGVRQDSKEAAKWFQLAADQRNAKARYKLGSLYEIGRGVSRNPGQAVQLYTEAASQGLVEAQLKLGSLYALGEAVPRDYVQAYMWFMLAAATSLPGDLHDRALENRTIVEKKMSASQVAEGQKLFKKWQPKVSP